MLHYKSGEWKVRHLAVICTLATHTNAQAALKDKRMNSGKNKERLYGSKQSRNERL